MGRRSAIGLAGLGVLAAASWWTLAPPEPPSGLDADRASEAPRPPAGLEPFRQGADSAPAGAPAASEGPPRERRVVGRVVDEAGRPVAGAQVVRTPLADLAGPHVREDGYFALDWASDPVRTDADGWFEGPGAPNHPFVRVVDGPEWSRSAAAPIGAPGAPVVLRVARSPSIAGVVLDAGGRPAGEVQVNCRYPDREGRLLVGVLTDGEGRFALRTPPGVRSAVLVVGALEGATPAPPADRMGTVLYVSNLPSRGLLVRLSDAAFLRGVVLGRTGERIGGVPLVAIGDPAGFDDAPRMQTRSAEDGAFEFGPLRPGLWTLIAPPHLGVTSYTERAAFAPADDVLVRLRESVDLKGRLVGEDVSGFQVQWVLRAGPEGPRTGTAEVGPGGAFAVSGLPDGQSVRLFARRIGDGRCALVEVVVGTGAVSIPLEAGLTIEGACGDYVGRVIAHQDDLQHEGRAEGGRFRIEGLPQGEWNLRRVNRWEAEGFAVESETGAVTRAAAGGAASLR